MSFTAEEAAKAGGSGAAVACLGGYERDTDLLGGDLEGGLVQGVGSPEQCCQACLERPDCTVSKKGGGEEGREGGSLMGLLGACLRVGCRLVCAQAWTLTGDASCWLKGPGYMQRSSQGLISGDPHHSD